MIAPGTQEIAEDCVLVKDSCGYRVDRLQVHRALGISLAASGLVCS